MLMYYIFCISFMLVFCKFLKKDNIILFNTKKKLYKFILLKEIQIIIFVFLSGIVGNYCNISNRSFILAVVIAAMLNGKIFDIVLEYKKN